ncbi:TFIIB-type zinc ribbon-containing protein [Agrococcus sp. SGAir0287]|uniref:TFIIB-type zinc ribbon-containing protein n=1 Tax=Agrococcus sp. SGAir0287 TaxID=2070347 RepID=UPI0010CD4271|nr:TFIIB-type zinc ribbon-containing protein [Agrococcus sp. SGAir0287]QCR19355.1 hypothetical protein C1N71_07890 [Agrococcus sp. SGAir0287]
MTLPPPQAPPPGPTGGGSPQQHPPHPRAVPVAPRQPLPPPDPDARIDAPAAAAPPVELAVPPQAPSTQNQRLDDGINRCPRCGSTDIRLAIDRGGMLRCGYCRNEWSEERVEERLGLGEGIEELRGTVVASGAQDIRPDAATILTIACAGCGAEVVIDTNDAMSARCHWCRQRLDVNRQIPNGAVPDAVLPFALPHADAVERIRAFAAARRFFAHPRFKAEFAPENVVGVYLPYMVVDAHASTRLEGVGEVETRRYTRGTKENRRTYYDADVVRVRRAVDVTVDDLTFESSAERSNLDVDRSTNNIVNSILPFDTKNAVAWNAAYLAGFTSERRDQDVAAMQPRFEDQLMSIGRAQVRPTLQAYDRGVRWETEALDVHGTRWVAMYLPVWLYSYHHVEGGRGMVHYVAVNGRTGETMGSIPLAKGRLLAVAFGVGVLVEALVLPIVGAALFSWWWR